MKLFTYLLGLSFIWVFTISLLRHEKIMKDSDNEK